MVTRDPSIPDPGQKYSNVLLKDLVAEAKASWKQLAKPYLARAEFNERMMHGDQWSDIVNFELTDAEWPDFVTRSSRNLLRNLILTYAAKLTEDRPFVAAYPTSPTSDIRKAEIATGVLRYYKEKLDWDDIMFQAAILCEVHGSVGFKTVWDPLGGTWIPGEPVIDELTGVPALNEDGTEVTTPGRWSGELAIEVLSIFDFGTDGAQDVSRSDYVWFSRHGSKYEARAMLKAAGYTPDVIDGIEEESYNDIWGDPHTGVPITEYWHRPGFRFPDGLYVVMVGDHVVLAEDFPYDHRQIPLSIAKIGDLRGSPFGSTHVNDAAPIQRSINKIVSALDRQAEMIAKIYLMAHGTVVQAIEDGGADHGMIPMNQPEWSQYTRYLEPPDRIAVLVSSLDDNTNALYAVFGLNELLTGTESMKSGTAAKSIAFLNKLDSMKMAGTSRSFNRVVKRVWQQAMALCAQYMPDEIFIEATDGTQVDIEMFRRSDFEGLDIRLEPASGLDAFSASGQESAMAQMQIQGPTPDLMDRAVHGLPNSRYQNADRKSVMALVEQAMAGQPVQADPNIDPNTAIRELTTLLSQYNGTQAGEILKSLVMQYKQWAQTAAMPPPQQGGPNGQQGQ